jgi:hypothetical protein
VVQAARRVIVIALVLVPTVHCRYDPPQIEIDAPALRPCELTVTDVTPSVLLEGTGAGGSRPALLVIGGQNLVSQNTSVTITAMVGSTRTPLLEIDNAKLEVGAQGGQLAVPITLPVDPTLRANEMVPLDVVVTQDCSEGPVTAILPGKLALRGLDELVGVGSTISLTGGVHEYSVIDVGAATVLVPAANQTSPIILRSRSSVKIASNISVSASGSAGGPGGGRGGLGGEGLGGVGTPGTGPSPGLTSGAPGGFNMNDPGLSTLDVPNRGSGGAGGDGQVVGGKGGRGGGGGGSIEVSAGGTLEVGKISAIGTPGEPGSVGGQSGGGGSGGVIFLRAAGALTAGELDVSGGGMGARGRARYDAGGTASLPAGSLGTDHFRGPMFADLPLAARSAKLEIVVSGKPLTSFKYFSIKPGGAVGQLSSAVVGTNGAARVTLSEDLEPGVNQICLVPDSGSQASETRNCLDIAYLP